MSAKAAAKPIHVDPHEALTDKLKNISSEEHVLVSVHDLVAYEYIDHESQDWRWGLGTIAALPGPRTVQLLVWRGGADGTGAPPSANPISSDERAAALAELQALRAKRGEVELEAQDIAQKLEAQHAHYEATRRELQQQHVQAEQELDEAVKVVRNVKEKDWREIRSYVKPPLIVELITEATVFTLGENPKSWTDILRVIRTADFVKRVAEFDPETIGAPRRRRLEAHYFKNPRFTYEDAMNGSRALGALYRWVKGVMAKRTAGSGLVKTDLEQKEEKNEMDQMEKRLARHRERLRGLREQEGKLCTQLGDLALNVEEGNDGDDVDAPPVAKGEAKYLDAAVTAAQRRRQREQLHGTTNTWSLTGETLLLLRSAILVNYDRPPSTVVSLTPDQVAQLLRALRARAPRHEQEAQAAAQRKRLEDELDALRAEKAQAMKALQDLKVIQGDQELALDAKERELEELHAQGMGSSLADHFAGKPPSDSFEGGISSTRSLGEDPAATAAAADGPKLAALERQVAEAEAALADKDKELDALRAQLEAAQRDAVPVGKDRSSGGVSAAGAGSEVDLSPIYEALVERVRVLHADSDAAQESLENVRERIESNPRLKAYMAEVEAH